MGTVVSYSDHKRGARGGKARLVDPVVLEVLEALLALGGCAHRQTVADQIAQRRGSRTGVAESAARDEIYAAFDAYLVWATARKTAPLLERPLGESSYRWAMTDAGRRLFETASPATRMVR